MYESFDPFEIPKDMYDIAPSLKIFDKLVNTEKQLDKLLQKKRVDIQEQLTKPFPKCKRTLRMHIFNTYSNQNGDFQSVKINTFLHLAYLKTIIFQREQPKWTIRIQGKLLVKKLSIFKILKI